MLINSLKGVHYDNNKLFHSIATQNGSWKVCKFETASAAKCSIQFP